MSVTTPIQIPALDAKSNPQAMNAEQGAQGVTLHSVPEIDGQPLSTINGVSMPIRGTVTAAPSKGTGAIPVPSAPTTVGTSPEVLLTAGQANSFIEIWNVSDQGTLWLSFGGTPAVGAAGCIPVPPMSPYRNPPGYVPQDACKGISDVAALNITVGAA